ncbi:AraC family transcriptional regulator [Pseudofrankia sp. BMG5.36]|uniref:helix-turn-helix domain-containing protein n=1 Tax=Pseudofrankia sp. BMG5.36 TaxID=1834512 RepID=UPI0009F56230
MAVAAGTRPVALELLPHLRRARDHIDRHYREPLDLDELARVARVSKFHFARCFEASYGETPIRYLTRRRIERAQDLLRHANLTITEICMLVGFSSLGSFSARFTQLVGETPSAYRDRWAARGAPHVPGCYLFMRGSMDLRGTAGDPGDPGDPGGSGDPASRAGPGGAGGDGPAGGLNSRNLGEAGFAGPGLR